MSNANRHLGSTLDDFLRQEGLLDKARAAVIKEAVAFQVLKSSSPNSNEVEMARAGKDQPLSRSGENHSQRN